MQRGATVLLTGLPSAGKSTIATLLAERLRSRGRQVEVLDGDEVRASLTAGLGFSRQDRCEHLRRIGWVAQLLARNGVTVLAPVIAPYEQARSAVRRHHESTQTPYMEVHVATPVAVCARRDVKGLYAMQARGDLKGLTGVDDPYEEPLHPELRVDTSEHAPAESADLVLSVLFEEVAAWRR
jgi:adenylylsulfate kinase